jgi:single-strand DNA-binding protein
MGGLNKVIIVGRLGGNPEERMTGKGTHVSCFSMATDRYRSANGEGTSEKITEWHRVVAYGKTAETCNNHLRKGRLACIEGSLQTRSWESPPGTKHFATEVVAARVTFLDSKGQNNHGDEVETNDAIDI